MIWGMTFDENYEDEVKVTIIATWFEEQSANEILKKPSRDILWRKIRKNNAEDFISRGTKDVPQDIQTEEKNTQEFETEDLETPAFIRKRLNN
jgi:cell division protein FtsZ